MGLFEYETHYFPVINTGRVDIYLSTAIKLPLSSAHTHTSAKTEDFIGEVMVSFPKKKTKKTQKVEV